MTAMLVRTCPLCGLRFSNLPLLELHMREDHRPQEPEPARDEGSPAETAGPAGKPEAAETQGPRWWDRILRRLRPKLADARNRI